jgi:predicted DCC family thiol-disulfide oxidoreductase YuxK
MKIMQERSYILFDGVCNLCNGFVQFVIKRDMEERYHFMSLTSEKAEILLKQYKYKGEKLSSVILLENDKIFTKSGAALRIFKKLNGFWPLLYVFMIVPSFVRNFVYDIIANNRYRWFGKRDSCMMPDASLLKRFPEFQNDKTAN